MIRLLLIHSLQVASLQSYHSYNNRVCNSRYITKLFLHTRIFYNDVYEGN